MKKTVKRLAALVFAAVLVFALAGCTPEKKAEKAVSTFLNGLKVLNIEESLACVEATEDVENSFFGENMKMYAEPLLGRMEYVITGSEKVDKNTVNVNLSITNVDMSPVLNEFLASALEYAFSTMSADPAPTEEEIQAKLTEILLETLDKEGRAMVTNDVTVTVKNIDGDWKVTMDGTFVNAILGGFEEAAKNMQNSLQ